MRDFFAKIWEMFGPILQKLLEKLINDLLSKRAGDKLSKSELKDVLEQARDRIPLRDRKRRWALRYLERTVNARYAAIARAAKTGDPAPELTQTEEDELREIEGE